MTLAEIASKKVPGIPICLGRLELMKGGQI